MLTVRSKKVNLEVLMKLIILLGFAMFFFWIILTGKVQLYVNPRIIPYVEFSIAVMIMISLSLTRDVFRPGRRVNLSPYFLYLIPLILAFALPAKTMDSTSMAFGDIDLVQQKNTDPQLNPAGKADSSITAPTGKAADSGLKMQGDLIVVSDHNFVGWIQEIYENMEKYEGKKIKVIGFVYKSKDFSQNEFVPARMMMACCTADLQPIGFLCRYEKTADLVKDTWIEVTGTIKVVHYNAQKTPVIMAEEIKRASTPENEYVYPY